MKKGGERILLSNKRHQEESPRESNLPDSVLETKAWVDQGLFSSALLHEHPYHTCSRNGISSAEAGPHTQVHCPWMHDCPHADPSEMEVRLKTDSGTAYPGLSLRDNERTVHLTHFTPKTGICIL